MDVQELVAKIQAELLGIAKNVVVHKGNDYIEVEIDRDNVVEAAKRLKGMGFDHVHDLTVVDYMKEGYFRVIYNLGSYTNQELAYYIVGLAYNIPRDSPTTVSLTRVYASAEFQEREAFEGFGITFEGHPDLKPLLLPPPVAEQKPLRKDFVVREEPEILAKPPKKA